MIKKNFFGDDVKKSILVFYLCQVGKNEYGNGQISAFSLLNTLKTVHCSVLDNFIYFV